MIGLKEKKCGPGEKRTESYHPGYDKGESRLNTLFNSFHFIPFLFFNFPE